MVATATAAVTLAYSSPEPYSAMITVLLPPVLILTWSGLRARERATGRTLEVERAAGRTLARGGWAAVVGAGIFLGFAATFYTLLLAYSAFTVVLMALILMASRWRQGIRAALDPLGRLAVIAVIAALIAAITWLPYLLRATRDPVSNTGSAYHYLPADGAELTFPMLKFTLLGALCMLGTLWLVVRFRSSVRAAGLAIGVVAVYLWSLLSMLATLARITLLSFRLQPTLTVLLATAGVFGFIEVTLRAAALAQEGSRDRTWGRSVLPLAAAIGLAGAIAFSQDIPDVLRPDLTIAYTDTDGHGQRGDRRPPGSEKFYPSIDAAITKATGKSRDETVVLTADYSFLSYYPYWGFQGLTSHYANPLAQFDKRAAAIRSWSKLKAPDEFIHALDTLPWAAPTVFLMRHGGSAGATSSYTLRLAEDVYPNQPNVRRYTVDLEAALFADPRFTVTTVGPFVLAIRKPGQRL
jgi:galactan 5-O-arabinofuranosyltransferase